MINWNALENKINNYLLEGITNPQRTTLQVANFIVTEYEKSIKEGIDSFGNSPINFSKEYLTQAIDNGMTYSLKNNSMERLNKIGEKLVKSWTLTQMNCVYVPTGTIGIKNIIVFPGIYIKMNLKDNKINFTKELIKLFTFHIKTVRGSLYTFNSTTQSPMPPLMWNGLI
jgi:hypothetical protein